jgi:hypothetical protein
MDDPVIGRACNGCCNQLVTDRGLFDARRPVQPHTFESGFRMAESVRVGRRPLGGDGVALAFLMLQRA